MINMVRSLAADFSKETTKQLKDKVLLLIKQGGRLDLQDSDGRDIVMHAVMLNNLEIADFLIKNAQ
jgi:Mg2+/Co2+ transporter CorC